MRERTITVGEDAMPMALHFDDVDPIATCYVRLRKQPVTSRGTPRCGWHAHGDSMQDAVDAWVEHLARDHKEDWPE